jgi:hypothetical protein
MASRPQIAARPPIAWRISLLCLVGLAALSSCARYPLQERPEPPPEDSQAADDLAALGPMRRGVPEAFLPAVEAIITAIKEKDNVTARSALNALFRRNPDSITMELARGFERLLDGRLRVSWMDLRLEASEDPEVPGNYELELVLSHHGTEELVYRAGGARLFVGQVAVGLDGSGQRGTRRDATPFPEEVVLLPNEEQRFPVAALALNPPKGVLAFASRLRFDLLPGQFKMDDGRYLPAQNVASPSTEIVRLAGNLPNAAVEPQELVDYVKKPRPFVPAMMERAVRIAPERRDEALDLLTEWVAETDTVSVETIVPALRWLARTDSPGGSAAAWRAYMANRAQHYSSSHVAGGLNLPGS